MRTRFLLFLVVPMLLTAGICAAQDTRDQSRWCAVKGSVLDHRGHVVPWAMVTLSGVDHKTLRITQTDRRGRFRFTWVDLSIDYEIYAERGNAFSKKIRIPRSSSKSEVTVQVELGERTKP